MSMNELEQKVAQLRELRRMQDELAAEIAATEDELKAYMAANNADTLHGPSFKITWTEGVIMMEFENEMIQTIREPEDPAKKCRVDLQEQISHTPVVLAWAEAYEQEHGHKPSDLGLQIAEHIEKGCKMLNELGQKDAQQGKCAHPAGFFSGPSNQSLWYGRIQTSRCGAGRGGSVAV